MNHLVFGRHALIFFNCPYTYHLYSVIYILLYYFNIHQYIHLTFNSYDPKVNNYETPATPNVSESFLIALLIQFSKNGRVHLEPQSGTLPFCPSSCLIIHHLPLIYKHSTLLAESNIRDLTYPS